MEEILDSLKDDTERLFVETFCRDCPEPVKELTAMNMIVEKGQLPLEDVMMGVIHSALEDHYFGKKRGI
ncbi:hypothetical protein [Halarsenatibacter silvermanii]|uniref:Uncharacterized protein n=1 Tax=Halarsenatibacter silvermanii TaxID=321763 RepID=A0A1G9NLZ0_9FIRM|nr:hypothetical protein [Halarsenatibacter silvermanii]SDL87333.1 hypothetical protein SAMN04488692_110117 [Halarsenatibacter silvermanii]